MKEYITIHNVGPLRHIEQLEILPLTVLIGGVCHQEKYTDEGTCPNALSI